MAAFAFLGHAPSTCSEVPLPALTVGDATGPQPPFIGVTDAALQRHQAGHSCIVQHFRGSDGGGADTVDFECKLTVRRDTFNWTAADSCTVHTFFMSDV